MRELARQPGEQANPPGQAPGDPPGQAPDDPPGQAPGDPGGLFDGVPCLAATPRTVEVLPGGLTNRNYKVSTPEGIFVARVWSPGDLLAINRDHEHRNSVAAAAAGVGAPVVAYRPEHGLLVLGFINGKTF